MVNRKGQIDLQLEFMIKIVLFIAVLLAVVVIVTALVKLFNKGNDEQSAKRTLDLLVERIELFAKLKEESAMTIMRLPNAYYVAPFTDLTKERPKECGNEACMCLMKITNSKTAEGNVMHKAIECEKTTIKIEKMVYDTKGDGAPIVLSIRRTGEESAVIEMVKSAS